MQTFSKTRRVNFREIPCFIEASSAESLATIRLLSESISDHVVACDSEKRKKMHLAAVLACNLTNHCYRLAERVLEAEQIDFRLFLPLIEEIPERRPDGSDGALRPERHADADGYAARRPHP